MIRFGCIYRVTFPDGKYYIGASIDSMYRRKNAHEYVARHKHSKCYSSKLSVALRRFNFQVKWKEIHYHIPSNVLLHLERDEIEVHDSYHNGYNSTIDGKTKGYVPSIDKRSKHSARMKGKRNPFYGKTHSPTKRKEWSLIRSGRQDSEETKRKKSIARLGEKNPMFGKTRSLSERRAMSDAKKRPFNVINVKTGKHHVVVGIEGVFNLARQHGARTGRSLYNQRCFKHLILIK